jgi:predicted adenylyl cyclase CyaB
MIREVPVSYQTPSCAKCYDLDMKDIEIEIQVKLERSEGLRNFLEKEGKFVSENRQVDEYYTPAHRDFVSVRPVSEWFRIRDENGSYSINYKKWQYDDTGMGTYADEYETEVGDKDTARKIIQAINMRLLVTVDKTRRKYLYKDYEVVFDSIVGLGNFVEIEYKGTETVDPVQTTDGMVAFLREHDCGQIERNNGGYPMQLLFPEDVNVIKL